MSGRGIRLRFDQADAYLRAAIEAMRAGGCKRVTVGVTGPVGAGKTTLARRLATDAHIVISTDNYLPDYELVPYLERDDPRHADLDRLSTNLTELRGGLGTMLPEWSFQTHRRESQRRIEPLDASTTIVVEGIHALHPPVRGHLDIAVYVDAPSEVRWRRWEQLELSGERGWGVDHARDYFRQVAEPWFARNAAVYRAAADYVVNNG